MSEYQWIGIGISFIVTNLLIGFMGTLILIEIRAVLKLLKDKTP